MNASLKGKRILFANFPADGHFNPLTGLAVYLQSQGADVRWYSGAVYEDKLKRLGIPRFPFVQAMELDSSKIDEQFPERATINSQTGKLKFDMIHAFILRGPEYYADLQEINTVFPFDVLVCDAAFTAAPYVKDLMRKPVVAIGVFPLTESSKDLPPSGLGLTPMKGIAGKLRDSLLRTMVRKFIFGEPNQLMHQMYDEAGITHAGESVFDMVVHKSDLLLQIGCPGFEYQRRDMSSNVKFIGSLLPYQKNQPQERWYHSLLDQYAKVVLVTQGTVEKDVTKLLEPTLEAFKDTDTLVIATTGGSKTEELKKKYPQLNLIIEDFIPFGDVMPYADVYITNGGYGGVMLGIENELPLVVAGVHEGKNEICARVGYFGLGINLKTEKPTASQLRAAVQKIALHAKYAANVKALSTELKEYNAYERCADHISALLTSRNKVVYTEYAEMEGVY